MCVARVGRVVSVTGGTALVDLGGQTVRALTVAAPEVAVGDDVLLASGLIVHRLRPEEAESRRSLFAEMIALAGEDSTP
jgi:hydrogenase maturation factor